MRAVESALRTRHGQLVVLAQRGLLAASDVRAYYNSKWSFDKAMVEVCSVLVSAGVPERGLVSLAPPVPYLPPWALNAPERRVWAKDEIERTFPNETTTVTLAPMPHSFVAPFIDGLYASLNMAGFGEALKAPMCEAPDVDRAVKIGGMFDLYIDLRLREEGGITEPNSIMSKLGVPLNIPDKAIYAGAGVLGGIGVVVAGVAIKRWAERGGFDSLVDSILSAERRLGQ